MTIDCRLINRFSELVYNPIYDKPINVELDYEEIVEIYEAICAIKAYWDALDKILEFKLGKLDKKEK